MKELFNLYIMLSKRIIPCLDIRDGRTVKGTRFEKLADLGDPLELAAQYDAAGADELVFLDITATTEGRRTRARLVTRIAKTLSIPFTVGGGIRQLEDVQLLLEAGADKVSVNSAAFRRPELLEEIAGRYGRQCLVLAIDSRWKAGEGYVCLDGGSTPTGVRSVDWADEADSSS